MGRVVGREGKLGKEGKWGRVVGRVSGEGSREGGREGKWGRVVGREIG